MKGPVPTGIWLSAGSAAALSSHSDGSTIPSWPVNAIGKRAEGLTPRYSTVYSSTLRMGTSGSNPGS